MEFTCIQCDHKFPAIQMDLDERVCNECFEKERYCMEVEFKHPTLDWGVLTDDNLRDLLKRFKTARDKRFDTSLGACPGLRIIKIEGVKGERLDIETMNELIEEL